MRVQRGVVELHHRYRGRGSDAEIKQRTKSGRGCTNTAEMEFRFHKYALQAMKVTVTVIGVVIKWPAFA